MLSIFKFSGCRSVSEVGVFIGGQFAEHDADVAEFDHGFGGIGAAFVVFAVAAAATVPGIAAFYHPADSNWAEAFRARRRRLNFDAPVRTVSLQPGLKRSVIVFVITEDHFKSWLIFLVDFFKQPGSRCAVIRVGTSDDNRYS